MAAIRDSRAVTDTVDVVAELHRSLEHPQTVTLAPPEDCESHLSSTLAGAQALATPRKYNMHMQVYVDQHITQ